MTNAMIVMCTTRSRENAEAIASSLIEARLAACVQIYPIESWYRWNEAVEHAAEPMLQIKTTAARFAEVEALIVRLHVYDVPEIVAVPVAAMSAKYASWMKDALAGADEA